MGQPTPGHPERDIMRGIENTSARSAKAILSQWVQLSQLNS